MGVGVARRGFDLGIGGAGPSEDDIAPDGVMEENGFLGDQGDLAAQVFE